MNPFRVLGLADNSSIEDARKVWRALRGKYHPDIGGNEAKFKEFKEAWEFIQAGYQVPPPEATRPVYASSFDPVPPSRSSAGARSRPYGKAAGPRLPATTPNWQRGKMAYQVQLQITAQQAAKGCTVPYLHGGEVMTYDVRSGTRAHTREITVPESQVIGATWGRHVTILVQLDVT